MLKAGAGKIEETKKVMQNFENIKKFQPLTPEPLLQNTWLRNTWLHRQQLPCSTTVSHKLPKHCVIKT